MEDVSARDRLAFGPMIAALQAYIDAEEQDESSGWSVREVAAAQSAFLHEPELIREQREHEREMRLQELEDEGFRLRDGSYQETGE